LEEEDIAEMYGALEELAYYRIAKKAGENLDSLTKEEEKIYGWILTARKAMYG